MMMTYNSYIFLFLEKFQLLFLTTININDSDLGFYDTIQYILGS